jgi:hypothetical protein
VPHFSSGRSSKHVLIGISTGMPLKSTATETPSCLQPQHYALAFFYGKPSVFRQERFVLLTHRSSLSFRLWQLSLARVVVGTGTVGVELLVIIIINGKSSNLSRLGSS